MNRVIAKPLTKEDFAPFGEVFDTSQFNGSAFVQETFIATDDAKRPVLQMVRIENVAQELTIRQLETHPFPRRRFLRSISAPRLSSFASRMPLVGQTLPH